MVRLVTLFVLAASQPSAATTVTCPSTPEGWSCPANNGCASASCSSPQWQEWVATTNIFRCMHGAPPASWSEEMATNVANHFENQETLTYSDSYKLPPPNGPSGENLFRDATAPDPLSAVRAWYSEYDKCAALPPGCEEPANRSTGHYTSLIWAGAQTIGCSINAHNLAVCRYKGLDAMSCKTPNVPGQFPSNVFNPSQSLDDCKAELQKCGMSPPPFTPADWENGLVTTATATATTTATFTTAAPVAAFTTAAPVSVAPGVGHVVGTASMPDSAADALRLSLAHSGVQSKWSAKEGFRYVRDRSVSVCAIGASAVSLAVFGLVVFKRSRSTRPLAMEGVEPEE